MQFSTSRNVTLGHGKTELSITGMPFALRIAGLRGCSEQRLVEMANNRSKIIKGREARPLHKAHILHHRSSNATHGTWVFRSRAGLRSTRRAPGSNRGILICAHLFAAQRAKSVEAWQRESRERIPSWTCVGHTRLRQSWCGFRHLCIVACDFGGSEWRCHSNWRCRQLQCQHWVAEGRWSVWCFRSLGAHSL